MPRTVDPGHEDVLARVLDATSPLAAVKVIGVLDERWLHSRPSGGITRHLLPALLQ